MAEYIVTSAVTTYHIYRIPADSEQEALEKFASDEYDAAEKYTDWDDTTETVELVEEVQA